MIYTTTDFRTYTDFPNWYGIEIPEDDQECVIVCGTNENDHESFFAIFKKTSHSPGFYILEKTHISNNRGDVESEIYELEKAENVLFWTEKPII